MNWKFLRNVTFKALLLFVIFNLLLVAMPTKTGHDQISLYNHLIPGRLRFPFGENPREAYNLSLYDVDAMFSAHTVSAVSQEDTLRIFVFGDSSVWGTLLHNDETLTGQLSDLGLTCSGQPLEFFNLGYPTISVTKDLMLMQRSRSYEADLIVWLTTLEAFPISRQLDSPLAANNLRRVEPLIESYDLPLEVPEEAQDLWSQTIFGRRRALADWLRLQVYGILWAATGVDQIYPDYTPAAWDLEAESAYYGQQPPGLDTSALLLTSIPVAADIWQGTPLLLVNEPIMISNGENSDIRYNFFYPRWAYDQYRQTLADTASELGVPYVDAWDLVPAEEFTNSAIHLTPEGELMLAEFLADQILSQVCK